MMTHNVRAKTLPLFYWDAMDPAQSDPACKNFKVGNFGDLASVSVVEWLSDRPVARATEETDGPRLLAIGSILHRARDGDVIWGSGLKGSAAAQFDAGRIDIRSCRGPITYDFLKRRGCDLGKVTTLFDPGSLAPCLPVAETLDPVANRGKTLIIPHFRELASFTRKNWLHRKQIVSVDCTLETMMARLIGAERVISSSLHGIIVAEALGVPAVWLRPMTAESHLKYHDYYYATERYDVVCHDTLSDALKADAPPLPRLDHAAMRASFPHDRIDELAR